MRGGKRGEDFAASWHIELILHLQRRCRTGTHLHLRRQRRIGQGLESQLSDKCPRPGQRSSQTYCREQKDPRQHARNSPWFSGVRHLLCWVTKRAGGLQQLSAGMRQPPQGYFEASAGFLAGACRCNGGDERQNSGSSAIHSPAGLLIAGLTENSQVSELCTATRV